MTRTSLVVLLSALSCTPCLAADPLAALLACRAVTDTAMRLACFDRETAHLDVKAAAVAAATPRVIPPPDAKKQFGLPEHAVAKQEVAAGTRAADTENIAAHIKQISQGANGRVSFVLDNDQVWRQLASSGDLLVKAGDLVTVSRAALGSYWLSTPTGRGCKVTRLR